MRIWAFIALAVAAIPAAAQPQTAAEPGQPAAQKAALFQRMLRDPTDLATTLAYAAAAAKLGDNEGAAGVLERLLLDNPQLARADVELAALYFRMGSFAAARAYLTKAKAAGAPPDLADRVARYEAEIDRIEHLSPLAARAPLVPAPAQPAPTLAALPPGPPGPSEPASASPAAPTVGVASAVNDTATGRPAGKPPLKLKTRDPVLPHERIETDASGYVQVLFRDQSTTTIGPGSDITIDDFAYDPQTGAGRSEIDAERGRLLLIGGRLSKRPDGVSLRTPSAILGVRGAVVLLEVHADGGIVAALLYGIALSVTGLDGVTETIRLPGYAISVARPGASPSRPFPLSAAELIRLFAAFEGTSGGRGGTLFVPTDADLVRSGISQVISGDLVESLRQAMQLGFGPASAAAGTVVRMLLTAPSGGIATNRCVTISPSQPCR